MHDPYTYMSHKTELFFFHSNFTTGATENGFLSFLSLPTDYQIWFNGLLSSGLLLYPINILTESSWCRIGYSFFRTLVKNFHTVSRNYFDQTRENGRSYLPSLRKTVEMLQKLYTVGLFLQQIIHVLTFSHYENLPNACFYQK